MDLLQLHYFRLLAQKEHLTNTAREILVSPSSLSATLSKLEDELGVTLFDRTGRKISLNEYGQVFLRYTEIALKALEDAKKEISDMKSENNTLSLSIGITMPSVWSKTIYNFLALHPEINLTFKALKLSSFQRASDLSEFDVILAEAEDFEQAAIVFEWERLGLIEPDERACIAVHPNHPLSQKKDLILDDIRNERFIAFSPDYAARRSLEKLADECGFLPLISVEHDYSLGSNGSENEIRFLDSILKDTNKYHDYVFLDLNIKCMVFDYAIGWPCNRYHKKSSRLFYQYIVDKCSKNPR